MASEKLSYNNEELMRTEGSKSKNKHISDILCILVLINLIITIIHSFLQVCMIVNLYHVTLKKNHNQV